MKKLINNIVIVVLLMIFPMVIKATGGISASPASLTIEVGSTKSFNIIATNTIGDVSISSSNSGVAQVSTSYWTTGMVDEGQTKTGSVTVTGVSEGTSTITLVLDAATFDSDDLYGQTRTVVVNVVPKKTPTPTPAPTPQPSNNTNNNQTNKEEKKEDKSNNNNLKEISIEGYDLTKVDNNNYTLSVSNDVTSINVNASAEDTKATITGTGKHDLNVGDNNIEIIIKSESGSENKINIKVTRNDGYYLEDLSDILIKDINDININIKADSKLSSQDLSKIKESKRKVKLNYYDDNKKLLYSWIIDGSKINDFDSLLTTVSYELEKNKDIYKLSNYADGMYIVVSGDNIIPKGTKIKLYVGDKYKDNDLLNIYYYNKNNKELINSSKSLKVKDGYIEFEVSESGDYFITMSSIDNSVSIESNSNGVMNILLIIIIILSILIVLVSTIMIILLKRKNKGVSNN